jgi:periplasmic divalent cation tolerance protein
MSSIVSVYAVFADADEAQKIARLVVEEKLAACANILGPCRSTYRWKGAVEEADEVAAILKARADKAQALMARIAELHSYDVPAIAIWPIDSAWPAYVQWVETEG